MGFFGEFRFAEGGWGPTSPTAPYFLAAVHDSDFVTVEYNLNDDGPVGRCYLGYEPRRYFEDPSANPPVDTEAEARGLSAWAHSVTGAEPRPNHIEAMLASPDGQDPEEVFAEHTLSRLLHLLGLPIPDGLPRVD